VSQLDKLRDSVCENNSWIDRKLWNVVYQTFTNVFFYNFYLKCLLNLRTYQQPQIRHSLRTTEADQFLFIDNLFRYSVQTLTESYTQYFSLPPIADAIRKT